MRLIKQLLLVLGVVLAIELQVLAEPQIKAEHCAEMMWQVTWNRFFMEDTHLFYDFISSYEKGKELAHLPTLEEVRRVYPNPYGYGTGMEDGMISAGAMMTAVIDRFAVTGETVMKAQADAILKGIELCVFAHGATGFVARAVAHQDLKSCYPATSRDQYTHAIHGVWHLYRSQLADGPIKVRCAAVARAMADRMLVTMKLENEYNSLQVDGRPDPRGIQQMWGKLNGHEYGRLPMIYAIAWELTGEQKYREAYRGCIREAVEKTDWSNRWMAPWCFPQLQCSLEVLYAFETEPDLKAMIKKQISALAAEALKRSRGALDVMRQNDLSLLPTDWRLEGGGIGGNAKKMRTIWRAPRECGEMLMAASMLPGDVPMDPQALKLIEEGFLLVNPERCASGGMMHMLSAYWRIRHNLIVQ